MGSTPPDPRADSGRHDGSSSEPSRPRVKRAQVPRACPRCRKLQKACSDFRPCQRCVRAGLGKQCGPGLVLEARLPLQGQLRAESATAANVTSHAQAGHHMAMPVAGTMTAASTSSASASTPTSAPSPPVPLINSAASPSTPLAYTSFARDTFHRQPGLLPPQVIQHCSARFHEGLYPTIPIVTPDYLRHLESRVATDATEVGSEAYVVLLGMCAMVMLQVEDPSSTSITPMVPFPPKNNRAYGSMLLEEALAAHRHLARRPSPSFEHVLLTFFIYASHGTLLHHSQAFFFLREATTLHHLTRPETMDPSTRQLSERLFWVLLISERSHGIRYRRPVTLQVTSAGPILPPYIPPNSRPQPSQTNSIQHQPLHAGFVCLAALFRPLDTSFIAILNQELTSIRPSIEALDEVEVGVSGALEERVMNAGVLKATQKANLHITQAWLLVTIWQLRLRLGQLIAPGAEVLQSPTSTIGAAMNGGSTGANLVGRGVSVSRTYGYPLQIARRLTLAVQDLPVDSVRVHGVGITEKVFDIACAVANVLARIPFFEDDQHAGGTPASADTGGSTGQMSKKALAQHDFAYLRGLMQQLPSGATIYEDLLVKHINQDTNAVVVT